MDERSWEISGSEPSFYAARISCLACTVTSSSFATRLIGIDIDTGPGPIHLQLQIDKAPVSVPSPRYQVGTYVQENAVS